MTRDIDVRPEVRSALEPSALELRKEPPRRGVLGGCAAAALGAPLVGFGLHALTGEVGGSVGAAGVAFVAALLWSAVRVTRGGRAAPGPMVWSFTPLGASVVVATDVLATSGDVLGPATYVLLAVPCAFLGGGVVFMTEIQESRRLLYSVAKAVAATVLILVPLPVGGLLGGGASLGHRLLRRAEEKAL